MLAGGVEAEPSGEGFGLDFGERSGG